VFGVPGAHNSVKNLVKFCSRSWSWKNRVHVCDFPKPVQDDATTPRYHRRDHLSHGMMRSQHVHSKDALELFIAGSFEFTYMRHSGAVDQDVHTRKLQNLTENIGCLYCIGKVAQMRSRKSAKLGNPFRGLLCCFAVEIDDANDSPVLREAERNRLTDTARSSCYHSHFVI